jgi:hypothetical protein
MTTVIERVTPGSWMNSCELVCWRDSMALNQLAADGGRSDHEAPRLKRRVSRTPDMIQRFKRAFF